MGRRKGEPGDHETKRAQIQSSASRQGNERRSASGIRGGCVRNRREIEKTTVTSQGTPKSRECHFPEKTTEEGKKKKHGRKKSSKKMLVRLVEGGHLLRMATRVAGKKETSRQAGKTTNGSLRNDRTGSDRRNQISPQERTKEQKPSLGIFYQRINNSSGQ